MNLLFPKEEEVMFALWDIGHPCAISEIIKTHPELNRNTVVKVLETLEAKGYLVVDSIVKTVTRTGRAFAPIISKEDYLAQKNLMSSIVESTKAEKGILSYCSSLIDTGDLDENFINEMESLIAAYKSKE